MDKKPEELQFIGLFGIYKEAYKITVSWRNIFSKITLSLILPISFIYLLQTETFYLIATKINENTKTLQETSPENPMYQKTLHLIHSEFITVFIFRAIYGLFILILSLLSTSAVFYTIGCIYTSKDITFKRVLSAVRKVWKRLMITFLWNFLIMFLYHLLAYLLLFVFGIIFVILLVTGTIRQPDPLVMPTYFIVFVVIFSIPYIIGLVYISIIWNLASVISVLEETYGLKAMMKGKILIKGKIWIASAIFVKLQILTSATLMVLNKLVLHGSSIGVVGRVSFGVFCFLLLTILFHFALVVQTIIYFVCKSYHNENINKSSLADHLSIYHQGEYVPLFKDDNDLESEQFSV